MRLGVWSLESVGLPAAFGAPAAACTRCAKKAKPHPDTAGERADADAGEGETIIEIIRYICSSGRPVDVGHILADEVGPRFEIVSKGSDEFDRQSTLHNPFGRLKIVSTKDVAEGN